MTHTLCLIPARGGSKGVPRKNLRRVAGRPLLAWTVGQALAVRPPTGDTIEVAVSTEDPEIATVAAGLGAVVVDRPADAADDKGRDARFSNLNASAAPRAAGAAA